MSKYPDVPPVCVLDKKADGTIGFITDNNQTEYPGKWDKSELTYSIIVKSKDAGIFSKQRKAIGISLSTWGLHIPVKFRRVKKTQHPDIQVFFIDDLDVPHIEGIPQEVLDYAQKTLKEKPSILAFAWYPKTSKQGIVVFNDFRYNWDVKDHYKKNIHYYNLIHTAIHEFGHTLGESHSEEANLPDVMDPYYHDQTTLSDYDVMRIREKYGTRVFSRWHLYARLKTYLSYRKKNM